MFLVLIPAQLSDFTTKKIEAKESKSLTQGHIGTNWDPGI